MSVVWKEGTVVFVRDRVRVERTAIGIAGGQSKVVEAAQDEASPTTLPGESPEAKNLLLGEGQSLLRAHFTKALFQQKYVLFLYRTFSAVTRETLSKMTEHRIAQELENEIDRVTRLWHDVTESLGIDPRL